MFVCINHPENVSANTNVKGYIEPKCNDKWEKIAVVCSAYAVVKPVTMMVKTVTASVTRPTMFGFTVDIGIANRALELKVLTFEGFSLS